MKPAHVSWLLLLGSAVAAAHHGNSEFDLTRTVRYEGTIVETRWINPHTVTKLETRTAEGEPIVLEIEGSSPAVQRIGGSTAETLKKGERVTAVVSPSRRYPKESAYGYEIIKSDGTVVGLVSSRLRRAQTTQATTTIFGSWVPTDESFARMRRSLAEVSLTEEGRAIRERYTPVASGQARCIPVSAPMLMAYPVVMVLERSDEHVAIKTDWLGAQRIVYMDGRGHPQAQLRFPQGHSTGRLVDGALIVETTNFTDQEASGVPSGAGKHLLERFELADDGKTLRYEFTWRDPQFLTDGLSGSVELNYRPDLAPEGIACDRENAERFFREFQ